MIDWRALERQAYQMLDQWRALLAQVFAELLDAPLSRIDELTRRDDRFEGR